MSLGSLRLHAHRALTLCFHVVTSSSTLRACTPLLLLSPSVLVRRYFFFFFQRLFLAVLPAYPVLLDFDATFSEAWLQQSIRRHLLNGVGASDIPSRLCR
jgi:hypothetical protein